MIYDTTIDLLLIKVYAKMDHHLTNLYTLYNYRAKVDSYSITLWVKLIKKFKQTASISYLFLNCKSNTQN